MDSAAPHKGASRGGASRRSNDWTAAAVKDRLRGRHPATQRMGVRTIPGPWTCIEEWKGIDLLAVCATSSPAQGRTCGLPYPCVGYEVKVSRSDFRAELKSGKWAHGREVCHEFYFAVPSGLLHDEEVRWDVGERNPEPPEGRGLWIPEDVGLVVVDARGCRVVKRSPVVREPEPIFGGGRTGDGWGSSLHALVRWVSARPDPRHDGVVERARARSRELTALRNGARQPEADSAEGPSTETSCGDVGG